MNAREEDDDADEGADAAATLDVEEDDEAADAWRAGEKTTFINSLGILITSFNRFILCNPSTEMLRNSVRMDRILEK